MPSLIIPEVAANQRIASAWGNQVADAVTDHDQKINGDPQAWTPTLFAPTSGTTPTVGTGGAVTGYYVRRGNITHLAISIKVGSDGTLSGNYFSASLPPGVAGLLLSPLSAMTQFGNYPLVALASTSIFVFSATGSNSPITWANATMYINGTILTA